MGDRIKLTYAFDAYCGWCYGFGPALHEFAEANAERIDLRVLSGGLFTTGAPIAAYPHISEANDRISQLTGVTFGEGYLRLLAEGSAVMDSTDAATGLVALGHSLDAAAALQRAWYRDGRSLSDPQVYRDLAAELGLDSDAVAAAYANPATRNTAHADFREVRKLGVQGYPTLLLHTEHGTHRLGGPTSTASKLTRALEQHLATQQA
ncbi:DsbA family protein [Micromonospora sp. ATCC 39149]|uniref:DsbA family protein n=1 Tax=Micromonospora carbonacea TaxID=47853 RepID=A0A7D5YDP3_9ACTN|nr:DsbA family protein [Micromonospora sp. ATCC 39149]QLJ99217.1 DsbA family protein [Micromonospora carbonacea]